MPYVIAVYDVNKDRTDVPRKTLRKYLKHVQNSVFEGEISEGELSKLKKSMEKYIKDEESLIIYVVSSGKLLDRKVMGEDPTEDHQFI